MNWLDAHHAEVLEKFRATFSDREWQLFRAGQCSWVTEYGTHRGVVHCAHSRQGRYVYCTEHNRLGRDAYGQAPPLVPHAVLAMDLTDMP